MRKFAILLVLVIGAVGCGSKPTAIPTTTTPTPTPAVTTAPTTLTPSVPTPTTLTRAQAAQRYQALSKPINAVFDEPKCSQAEDFFVNGGSWPPNSHPEWDDQAWRVLRGCHTRLIPLFNGWIKAAQSTPWPVDAREDMDDLVLQDQALLRCLKKGSRAKSDQDMTEVFECVPKDDGSADRVRARFGLPRRTE
jgi:hypothetical protein